MPNDIPTPASGPGGNGVRLGFKVAAVLALILVAFAALKFAGKKSAVPDPAVATAEPSPEPAVEPRPSFTPVRASPPRPMIDRPASLQPAALNPPREEPFASNLWAAAGSPSQSKKLIWRRLPELQSGVDGIVARFEPPAFYDVADRYVSELRSDFTQVA